MGASEVLPINPLLPQALKHICKLNTEKKMRMKRMCLVVCFVCLICNLKCYSTTILINDSIQKECIEVFDNTEEVKAKFIGDFEKYVNDNVELDPEFNGVARYVTLVTIGFDGSIQEVVILKYTKGCEPMNEYVLKLLRYMPKWEPAKKNGINVTTRIVLNFKIDANYYNWPH